MKKKPDARTLSHTQLTDLRRRAVSAVQNGESPEDVARTMQVNRVTVYGWLALFRDGGWNGLDAKKRGGRKPVMTAKMLAWVYRAVTMGDPRQYKFAFALWSSKMVARLIERKFGIRLSKASVCRLLGQLGLSAQRPLWRAYQRDPEAVARWLGTEFPRIRRLARKQGADIWFGDEAGVRSDDHKGTTWAKKGRTPVVRTTGARFGLNLVSAVNRRGQMRFMCVQEKVTSAVFIDFLSRLSRDSERPVFLVVDGHPAHRAKATEKFVRGTGGRLRLFFLPAYSPDLNPDELVWNDLKNNGVGRMAIAGPDAMKSEVIRHMKSLQRRGARIRSFFRSPTTKYAA